MTAFDTEAGRRASLRRWAFEPDPSGATQQARDGFLARFERQVDPKELLDPTERERRARRLMRAHMIELSQRSRAKRAAAKLRARPRRTA